MKLRTGLLGKCRSCEIKYDNNGSRITGSLLGNTANQKTGDMSG